MPVELQLLSPTPSDTRRLAATVAGVLRAGDVIALTGELGAGKTCFVQGAASALGVNERVTSPSFLLRRDYPGRLAVVHLDVYRLETLREVADLGYEEEGDVPRVTFIEWADAMSPLLPAEYLELEFHLPPPTAPPPGQPGEHGEVAEPRRIVARPRGPDWLRRMTGLASELEPWRDAAAPPGTAA